jgi:HEAT repeat protein
MARLDGAENRALIVSALKHRHASIRALALRQYNAADLQQVLLDALLDGSAAVRRLAANELSKRFGIEARTIWRDAAQAGAKPAVLALCQLGEREDVELLKPFARHPTAAVRARVLHALAKLGAADVDAYLVLALSDSSKTVVRQAIQLYRRDLYFLDADTLLQALHTASEQTRRVLITAVHALDKWQGLRVLLRRRIEGDEYAKEEGKRWVEHSSNRYTNMPDDLRAELTRLLETARSRDPEFDPRFLLDVLRLS